jgi:hypothetical protein
VSAMPGQQLAAQAAQQRVLFFDELGECLAHLAEMEREHDAAFSKQTANLVPQLRAAPDQATANAVQSLEVLLSIRLAGNETHVGAAYGFADRLGITGVVLLRLKKGFDELRSNQPRTSCPKTRKTRVQ